ncbi:hypothetical protein GPJ56_003286 [Histomonas meleagridis]|uniref:uncharacterized protein n=1 Tax=Histomonas meleagridis TaxID=135588 RepID=UPI003559C175|nr:hypothetical protein GPJ56_003286 [Histomonas meleagridis]KAH0805947.1 hypothetical protein GO595_001278 [Histomonas meleagridis]
MEYQDSKAAVDAMAALQERIRDLEHENAKLKKECQHLSEISSANDSTIKDQESFLVDAANKAKEMLDNASQNLVELRKVKHENRKLQITLEELKKQRTQKIGKEDQFNNVTQRMLHRKRQAEKLISEYEELFCEILSPPDFQLDNKGNVPFNNTTFTSITHSLPATLQTVLQTLQTLPFPFRTQKLEKKKEIIGILLNARDIAYKISDEIHQLELKKMEGGAVRRVQSEIDVKSVHLHLLVQAMSKFRFE